MKGKDRANPPLMVLLCTFQHQGHGYQRPVTSGEEERGDWTISGGLHISFFLVKGIKRGTMKIYGCNDVGKIFTICTGVCIS